MTDLLKRLHDAANKSRDEAWRPIHVTSESMALDAALAELDRQGYAIVPKKPTDKMAEAGAKELEDEGLLEVVQDDAIACYLAMINAGKTAA
jgi:hypothetical protein